VSEGFAALAGAIAEASGLRVAARPQELVSGGGRDEAWRWPAHGGHLFVKLAPAPALARLACEAAALGVLAATGQVRVPAVFGHGATSTTAWLALEWLDLSPPDAAAEAALGAALARLHGCHATHFGFAHDNYIGGSIQANGWLEDAAVFLARRRIAPQLSLARANGYGALLEERGRRLLEAVPALYAGYQPAPSLLHGDLWAGNRGMVAGSTPVVFDPAAYYGDREADIAMTHLFGGFGAPFYAAYQAGAPLDAGAAAREALHNLYHVLNHLNLFGRNYLAQARALIDRLLAETGH
jgi:fructosamine-3-kinase